jgi:hypothetical protein
MAYEIPGFTLGTLTAAADLSTKEHRFVAASGTGVGVAGAGADILGVLNNKPVQGAACTIIVDGVAKVVAEGAIAYGAEVMVGAAGGAVTATATNQAVGIALAAAAAANEVIPILLKDLGTVPS